MAQPLSQADKNTIASADSSAMESSSLAVGRYMANYSRWLGGNNRYRHDPVATIDADVRLARPYAQKHLAEYIAASVPLHVADGWGYLGRAVHCHASGNPDIARHLAYYAELRAAMALLGAHGIGIFNSRHFVVDHTGTAKMLSRRGTHEAAWLYLEEWANSPAGAAIVGTEIRPEGYGLAEWVKALPGQPAWQPVVARWLLTFGLDLKRLGLDRDARNRASYRPTRIWSPTTMDVGSAAEFVVSLVAALEPSAPSSFGQLDLHLLRLTLESGFAAASNNTPRQAPVQFRNSIESVCEGLIGEEARRQFIMDFLTRKIHPADAVVIAEARKQDRPTTSRHHAQVICRAALLLRLATGAAAGLIRASGMDLDALAPWWSALGSARGLWRTVPHGDSISDIWEDIAAGLSDIDEWIDITITPTYRDFLDDCAQPLNRVSALESLAIAGINP